MGGSSSKPEEKADKSQAKEEIIEQSSGFHIVEIHIPTVNKGIGFLVFLAIATVALVWLYRTLRRRMKARHEREARGTNHLSLLPLQYQSSRRGQRPGAYAWHGGMPMQAPAFFNWPHADVHVGSRNNNANFQEESRFQEVDDDVEEGLTGTWRRGQNSSAARGQSGGRPMP